MARTDTHHAWRSTGARDLERVPLRNAHRALRIAQHQPSPSIFDTHPREAYSEGACNRASGTLVRNAPNGSDALFPGIDYRRHPDLAESQGRHFARNIEGLGASGYRMVQRPLLTSG